MCTENYHWHHDYVRLAWDSGFCFDLHKAKSNFDWSSIGLVDIDRVSRDRDIATVEKHITTVLHFTLDEDQTKILDPTFVKVFRLSQLSLQYLQFCKRYLDNTVVLLKKQLSKTNEENSHLRERSEELEDEVGELKKKVKELKLSLPLITEIGCNIRCGECAKMFLTEEFLLAHMKRRHGAKDVNPLQKETDKLQLEIKELKERLNSAVQVEHSVPSGDSLKVDVLQDKFEQLKEHVERELNALRDQKHYQEKYERWFELVFQRLEHSQKELLEKKEITVKEINLAVGDGDKKCAKESCTQTELETVKEIVVQDSKAEVEQVDTDLNIVKKMQEDIRINTESHLDQIQDVLQQKLTGGLEEIQTQMKTFWEKINELQVQQTSLPSPQIQVSSSSSLNSEHNVAKTPEISQKISEKPKPAPRVAKIADLKQANYPTIPDRQLLQTYYVTTTNDADGKERSFSEGVSTIERIRNVERPSMDLKRSRAKLIVNRKTVKRPKVVSKKSIDKVKETLHRQSDSSDEEPKQHEVQVLVKASNTSTLAQKSITSLKNLLSDHDVQQGLKEELEEMVSLRLKEIGVSPHWSGLPLRSYTQALSIITHRAELFAKKNPEYLSMRSDILDKVDFQLGLAGTKPRSKIAVKTYEKAKPISHISRKTRQRTRIKKAIESVHTDSSDQVEVNVKDDENAEMKKPEIKITSPHSKLVTPVKKKVLFDLETSSSVKSTRINEDPQNKENLLGLTKQNVELLVTQPRTVFKSLDTDTSVASSVLDGSKNQVPVTDIKNVVKATAKSGNDVISDWEMSDVLT